MTLQCGPFIIDLHNAKWARTLTLGSGILLLSIYAAIFLRYLPTDRGTVGNDYSLFFPDLLTGYFHFLENGIWQVLAESVWWRLLLSRSAGSMVLDPAIFGISSFPPLQLCG